MDRALDNQASCGVRKGEALMLDLRNGKKFGVTVDEAATAAGLVNTLVGERGSRPI